MAISIDGTNGLTTDNAALKLDGTTLVVDDTNNRVGIGTTSPAQLLTLENGDLLIHETGSSDPLITLSVGGTQASPTQSWLLRVDNSDSDKFQIRNATGGSTVLSADTSGNLQFNSGYGSVATAYGCRAWVNFNGTGTVAIRDSGNVSSITDDGVGRYYVNFTNSMPDDDYARTNMSNVAATYAVDGSATTTYRLVLSNPDNTAFIDASEVSSMVVR